MRYRLMTHTQSFFEDGQWVERQMALDEDDRVYFFTAARVAELESDAAPDAHVARVDDLHRDPFAHPDQSAVDPTVDPDSPAPGHEAPVEEPDLPEVIETEPGLGPEGRTGGRIQTEPDPTFGPGGVAEPPADEGRPAKRK